VAGELARCLRTFGPAKVASRPKAMFSRTVRTALAASRAGNTVWVARADTDLAVYLDAALTALAAGFAPVTIAPPASSGSRCSPLSM
jgi:hypothetical protein